MAGGTDDTIASDSLPRAPDTHGDIAETIAGRYKLVRWLGGGGMGRVYEVYDEELGERVALKVLKSGLSDDAIERFRREVRLTRRIQHKNVARMFDIGAHNGDRFLTMELVEGHPLTRELGQPLAWSRVQKLAVQICDGLAAAHAIGVVHRDLKPDNVLIESVSDRAVITDFGIARTAEDVNVTQEGAVIGTPRYMAPEQLAGQDIDARADIFSLGVMLFELATGKRPWSGDNLVAIAVAQQTQPPRALVAPGFPGTYEELVKSCLAIVREDRIASAGDVAARLAAMTMTDTLSGAGPSAGMRSLTTPPTGSPTLGTSTGGTMEARIEETTLAVLPFQCAPADEYLADGAFEEVIDTLSTTQGLRVKPAGVARTAANDPRAIGQQLQVDVVVAGSLRRTPHGLRTSARLIAVADGFQIWSHKIDGSEADVLATTAQLSRGISDALSAKAKEAATRSGMDPRVVDLYLRAKAEQRRFWGEHQKKAKELLEQALAIAPGSAPLVGAHAYATVQSWIRNGTPQLEAEAAVAVDRALSTGSVDAHLAAASLRLNRGDHVGAGHAFGLALRQGPMLASVNESVGRVLTEIESASSGRQLLDVALGLEPSRWHLIDGDLLRLDCFELNWSSAERRIARLLGDPDPAIVQLGAAYQARYSIWRRDYTLIEGALSRLGSRLGPLNDQLNYYFAWKKGTPVDTATWRASCDRIAAAGGPQRLVTMNLERMVEMGLAMKRHDDARYALRLAVDSGLVDRMWMEQCPLFEEHQADPGFGELRAQVAARANDMLVALRTAR